MSETWAPLVADWERLTASLEVFYVQIREVPDNAMVFLAARLAATLKSHPIREAIGHIQDLPSEPLARLQETADALRRLEPWFVAAQDVRVVDLEDRDLQQAVIALNDASDRLVDALRDAPSDEWSPS